MNEASLPARGAEEDRVTNLQVEPQPKENLTEKTNGNSNNSSDINNRDY